MGKVSLLDCTLRDGGYVNDWLFGEEAIKGTSKKIAYTGVEFFEIGFLKNDEFNKDRAVFPNVECIAPYISPKNASLKYVGMIDCGNPVPIENIETYSGKSLDALRIIFKKDKIDFAYDYCKQIKEKGYMLFVQFVGTDSYTDLEFIQLIQKFNNLNPYAMSIVDTFGTIKRKQFLRMVYIADNNMNKDIVLGYHAHNNLQQAFGNAETMVELNLSRDICIDACVFGMGRGAGNLNLELFADYMNENYGTNYKIEPMLEIMDYYLQESYNKKFWGYCLPYYLSASNNCHPNYAIYYAEKDTLPEKCFNELLKSIPVEKRRSFSKDDAEIYYKKYMSNLINDSETIKNLESQFSGKDILLLAPGKTLITEKDKIENIIKTKNPCIVSINCNPTEFNSDYIFSSNMRRYAKLQNISSVKKIITSNVKDTDLYDYKINFSTYCLEESDIIDNSGLMFLKLLSKMNVSNVYIAGMDGYSSQQNYYDAELNYDFSKLDIRNSLIEKNLKNISNMLKLSFITTSNYRIN